MFDIRIYNSKNILKRIKALSHIGYRHGQDSKCEDPCDQPCVVNARCSVKNHKRICTCLDDYRGDPYIECKGECCSILVNRLYDFTSLFYL